MIALDIVSSGFYMVSNGRRDVIFSKGLEVFSFSVMKSSLCFTDVKIIAVPESMHKFIMFITAVCILFLIKLRWPKNKSQY